MAIGWQSSLLTCKDVQTAKQLCVGATPEQINVALLSAILELKDALEQMHNHILAKSG